MTCGGNRTDHNQTGVNKGMSRGRAQRREVLRIVTTKCHQRCSCGFDAHLLLGRYMSRSRHRARQVPNRISVCCHHDFLYSQYCPFLSLLIANCDSAARQAPSTRTIPPMQICLPHSSTVPTAPSQYHHLLRASPPSRINRITELAMLILAPSGTLSTLVLRM